MCSFTIQFLAHLTLSFCYHSAFVVHLLTFDILLVPSDTSGKILTKLSRDDSWMVPFQNGIQRMRLSTKMAAKAINILFILNSPRIF